MRTRWNSDELEDLTMLNWDEFQTKYPYRTYDSWEVKRRRIDSGSSGTRVPRVVLDVQRRADILAMDIMTAVSKWASDSNSHAV